MAYERNIVLDFEWTPIDREYAEQKSIVKHEIIQIGAVMLDGNYRKISYFSTFVKPMYTQRVKASVSKLTGITDKDLVNAPSLADAIDMLVGWIGSNKKTRVFSWSDTDLFQLEDECYLKGIQFPCCMYRWVDFQRLYGYLLGYRHQLSLKDAVMSANGQFLGAAHTALYDAMATAELLIITTSKEEFTKRTKGIREMLAPPKKCCTTIGELYGTQLARFLA